jgi:CheY-like chemotaxis protein
VSLLTGAFEPIDETRARAVGCDGVLVKPFEPQMVINRVKDLLAGRKAGQTDTPAPQPQAPPGDAAFAAPAPHDKGSDSLEDYFDRLDAAFATLNSDGVAAGEPAISASSVAAPAAPRAVATASSRPATVEDFASWDPELAGDETRSVVNAAPDIPQPPVPIPVSRAPEPPAALQHAAPAAVALAPATVAAPAPPPPAAQISLAEAFATLLTAEHGQAINPLRPRQAMATPAAPSPEIVEDIVRQVLDRLQNEDVRQTVVDVAERLVREEIDRIKRSNA